LRNRYRCNPLGTLPLLLSRAAMLRVGRGQLPILFHCADLFPGGRRSDQKARWTRHLNARRAGSDTPGSLRIYHFSSAGIRRCILDPSAPDYRPRGRPSVLVVPGATDPRRVRGVGSSSFAFRNCMRGTAPASTSAWSFHMSVYTSSTRERTNRAAEPPADRFGTLALPAHSQRESRRLGGRHRPAPGFPDRWAGSRTETI
jgi:hypothetical protein